MSLGGSTIRELQSRMGVSEVALWVKYFKKHGPHSAVRKYDRPAALLAYVASRISGGKSVMTDFMPFGREDEKEATFEDIVNILVGAKGGKSR